MKEKIIVSTATLVTSLASYYYAKTGNKDAIPYMMLGGFLGAVIGETIVYLTTSKGKSQIPKNKI
ncbi:MAG TPA: hypothetical protein VK809_04110 [Bacteroidia bacterium]|jgi:hypothetical protein|nr:hypothetical protein [Bacteroidia bacterium]